MRNSFLGILSILAITSCTKVIDIDLNSADPQYVIEAEITNEIQSCRVKISRSVNFSESNDFPTVSGAIVNIKDNLGNTENLSEIAAGIYESKTLKGIPGRTYFLSIQHDGKVFSSQSTMPELVTLLEIDFIKNGGFGGGGPGADTSARFTAVPLYNDPAGVKNFYRFEQSVNGKRDLSILVRNDNLSDGKQTVQPLFSFGNEILRGDTLQIQMQCIDNAVYEYFYSLNASSGNGPGGGTTPSNPVNNISGALGYFSACSVSEKEVIVN
ncbi:MAG: DUF4249 domain-containing protein [Saprospiraceae bacterium]